MTVMKIDHNLFPRLANVWEDFLSKEIGDTMECRNNFSIPAVNIVETTDAFKLHLAVPGMHKEDFKINLENGVLTVSAEKKDEHYCEDKNSKITRKEFCYFNFKRSFTLPETVVLDRVEAAYENGILAITIPKVEQTQPLPTRSIAVK